MATSKRRTEWHQVKGKWTRSLGERGLRVRLFQKRRDGPFYRAVWVPGRGRNQAPLGTADRHEADRLGRLLLAELLNREELKIGGPLTLETLWTRFARESPAFLDNALRTLADAQARARTLLGFFGTACVVDSLSARDQAAYAAARRAGGIKLSNDAITRPVRARSVEADLILLHTMLSWATTVREPDGRRLLQSHPLAGVRRVREQNPRRPLATWERFQSTRNALKALRSAAETTEEATRWLKVELALVLAEATGRRLGSIRQLRWDDIDFTRSVIRWRAEADKKRRESVVPVPESLLGELREFRRELGAVAGWIFAAETAPTQPMDRHLFDKWLMVAERVARLPKLEGGLWHPYRRKWATERKHLPLTDVAAAGGWKDTETLLTCYQQPDNETLLAVMSEQRKVRETALGR